MPGMRAFSFVTLLLLLSLLISAQGQAQTSSEKLVIGDTFVLTSTTLQEPRRINVYLPDVYHASAPDPLPVLYMPDGGLAEDFLHIAGLVQIGALNGSMRPFILVGIENTQRRRDLTGPTQVEEDLKIAPVVGGSAAFRQFIRHELMPQIQQRYRTSGETAIIGESLAGLFVLETLMLEPDLFDSYIAVDPSLWWDNERLVTQLPASLAKNRQQDKRVFIAAAEIGNLKPSRQLVNKLGKHPGMQLVFRDYPDETHMSLYHPAALDALRLLFPVTPQEPAQ